jgi:hypothetical protein
MPAGLAHGAEVSPAPVNRRHPGDSGSSSPSMIPDAYVAPLISLGLGAVGTLGGLFFGFVPTA